MPEPPAEKSAADRLLDLTLFAPVGLAVALGEALPELARKGRSLVGPQLGVARTVGQLAVDQGRQRLDGALPGGLPSLTVRLPFTLPWKPSAGGPLRSTWERRRSSGAAANGPSRSGADGATVPGAERPTRPVARRAPDIETATGHVPVGGRPSTGRSRLASGGTRSTGPRSAPAGSAALTAEDLAVPSYDSLSAFQVVQRLAGLTPAEVRAVRAYEAATRGRRTILARADQLLAGP